jgi:molecular chaperone DnaK (HSP70)
MQTFENALAPVDARILLAAQRLRNIDDRIVAFHLADRAGSQLGEVAYVFTVPDDVKEHQRQSLEDAVARIPHAPLPAGEYVIAELLG